LDYGYLNLESGISGFAGRKTGQYIPCWLPELPGDQTADCSADGKDSGECDFLGLMAGTKKRNNQSYGKTL